jgi:serine/threonine protein kinase
MNDRDWKLVEDLFHRARELAPEERDSWVHAQCADDRICTEVLDLLAAEAEPQSLIDSPSLLEAMSAAITAAAPAPGQTIGSYRIEREIGHGGMGTVYAAVRADEQFEKLVAVKVMRADWGSERLRQRFRTERQILAKLEHPNIARLIDGGVTATGQLYLVMEYVAGRPVDVYCREERLDRAASIRLFQKLLAAVGYAHRNLVIHRDLKPSNILVTGDGEPKLLDFGLAKLTGTAQSASAEVSQLWLTPSYSSPEQIRG